MVSSPSTIAGQAVLDSLETMIVARIDGRDVTRGELRRAFDAVANPTNWKLPVRGQLTPNEVEKLGGVAVIREAVIFFTGSVPTIGRAPHVAGNGFRVVAEGYYSAVGA